MKYFYGEYDGQEFPTQDKLFGFDQLMQFIMQYGDPVSELDLHQTLHNAMHRAGVPASGSGERSRAAGMSSERKGKISFNERDLELHLHEGTTSCSTVVLIDQSGSMGRYGRM